MEKKKEKSELIQTISLEHGEGEVVGVYKEEKSYLHGGGYLELDGRQLGPDEYISILEEENKGLKKTIERLNGRIANLKEGVGDQDKIIENLKEKNEELKEAMKELNNYNKFRIQENQRLKKENEELQEYKRMYEGLG